MMKSQRSVLATIATVASFVAIFCATNASAAESDVTVIFQDDFEGHAAGAKLSAMKPTVGGNYQGEQPSVIAAASAPGAPTKAARGGAKFPKHTAGADQLVFLDKDAAAAKGQTLRFTFDIYVTSASPGAADIQTFRDSPATENRGFNVPPDGPLRTALITETRGFNLLLGSDGRIQYYTRDWKAVEGKFKTDAWVPVEVVADYARQVFKATVGEVTFGGKFDTTTDQFNRLLFAKSGSPVYYYDNVKVEIAPALAGSLTAIADAFVSTADLVTEYETRVSPFDVGNRAQLFVDRVLVRDTDRVWFTQHQGKKHPDNPLVKADQPWEGWRLEIFGSVIYDEQEKLFKMWYLPEPGYGNEYFDDTNVTCYATSTDGIRWQKPLVGTLPSKNGKPHNAVTHHFLACVIKDMKDPDPSRRYKMVCWKQREPMAYHTLTSPDGLHWSELSKSPITHGGDVLAAYWDPRRNLYVAFPKQCQFWRGHDRRVFSTIVSKDFVHWSQPALSWTTDLRDDAGSLARIEQVRPILDRPDNPQLMRTEYYGLGVYPAESCTIGFPWILTVNNDARWGNQEGPEEIQLAVSRDLVNWERPFRTPVIAIGEVDRWDASYHTCAASAIRYGDEIRLYYAGANYTHGSPSVYRTHLEDGTPTGRKTKQTSSIGLVTWKLDRFVSADGPAEGGVLTTVPVKFTGKRLEINAATKPGGSVVVEICDAAGKVLPGFTSDPFSGDNLRHVVTFQGKSDVAHLAGKPVVLQLHLKNAEFYSFAFRD
jgi:hypothetical protein